MKKQKKSPDMYPKFPYLLGSLVCTVFVVMLAFSDAPVIFFNNEWAELVMISLLFTGSILFLAAGLRHESKE